MRRTPLVAAVGAVLSLLVIASTAWAKPPPNNSFNKPTVISSLPFTTTQDPSGATLQHNEPQSSCNGMADTVWYRFTTPPTNVAIIADTFGSNFDTVLAVWTRSGKEFTEQACNDNFGTVNTSALSFLETGGTTYYFQIGVCCSPQAALPANPTLDFDLHF